MSLSCSNLRYQYICWESFMRIKIPKEFSTQITWEKNASWFSLHEHEVWLKSAKEDL